MLYKLLYSLHTVFFPFNVFRYITFRTALAVLTAAILTVLLCPILVRIFRKVQLTELIREDGPKHHSTKAGTPTMGGIVVILSIIITVLLWGDLGNNYILVMILSLAGFGLLGFSDDYLKLTGRLRKDGRRGLSAKRKFLAQSIMALMVGWFVFVNPNDPYHAVLSVPFFKNYLFNIGLLFIPFAMLVIVGSSNAVNLTDGIDGLAVGLVAIATLANGLLVYISGHKGLAEYLHVLYIPTMGEVSVFCGAMFGAALGFLWYNSYPADIFMGDVGSLGLGGALGTLAVISKQEIVLVIVGGIFVAEVLSVVFQVASFKLTGKRLFRMAPLHHHFELLGWPEPKIIVRFWIAGILLALLSLATLKVR